jgi:hypothetical protein
MRNKLLGGKSVPCDRHGIPLKQSDKDERKKRMDERCVRTKDWWAQ